MKSSLKPADFSVVGVISGVKGLKGELRLHFFAGEASWAPKLKIIRLSKTNPMSDLTANTGLNAEQKIVSLKAENSNYILRLAGVDTREKSEALKGIFVAVPSELLQSKKGEALFLGEVLGYKVFDGELCVGLVRGFQTNSAQDLLAVTPHEGTSLTPTEILIPFVKDFTVKIDHEKKEIKMVLPEGLLTVNRAL